MKENFTYIEDVDALSDWCKAQEEALEVAIDTEFERHSTYYPELCLVQLATAKSIALVDPIRCKDTSPLAAFLNTSSRIKVLHAARQDLEVMDLIGVNLGNSFVDTQLAAALVGEDEQIGYGELVKKLAKIELDKKQQRANWKRRPLPEKQLDYAVSDVLYLLPVFHKLKEELNRLDRLCWLEEECTSLGAIITKINTFEGWERLKNVSNLKEESKRRAFAMANWRESEARRVNLPRNWILQDSEIRRVAIASPQDIAGFADLLKEKTKNWERLAKQLLSVLKESEQLVLPIPELRAKLTEPEKHKAKLLTDSSAKVAQKLGIKPAVLMTVNDSKRIVLGERMKKYYTGWRGAHLLEIFQAIGVT